MKDLKLALYTDADFAGDRSDMKSTSGVFLALIGTHSFLPLGSMSKKQQCVSHSSVESELVACDLGVRTIGMLAQEIWETILGRQMQVVLFQDNQPTASIIRSGKAPTLRHIHKVLQVDICWIKQAIEKMNFNITDCDTRCMAADVFTKHFINREKFEHACRLIGVVAASTWKKVEDYQIPEQVQATAC